MIWLVAAFAQVGIGRPKHLLCQGQTADEAPGSPGLDGGTRQSFAD